MSVKMTQMDTFFYHYWYSSANTCIVVKVYMTDFLICSIKSPQCTDKYSKKKYSIVIFLSHVLTNQKCEISLQVGYKAARPKTGDFAENRLVSHFLIVS